MKHQGSCHCGAIQISLTILSSPEEIPVRACGCSFCRSHGARNVTDQSGLAEIHLSRPDNVSYYRFGLETADFLICRRCGVYVAAVAETASGLRATVNINALDDRNMFVQETVFVDYSAETTAERSSRRSRRWTPAVLHQDALS